MDKELTDGLFEALMKGVAEPEVQKFITTEQKQAVLDALNVTVEEMSEDHVRVKFLFLTVDVDGSDPDNPKVEMSVDLMAMSNFI